MVYPHASLTQDVQLYIHVREQSSCEAPTCCSLLLFLSLMDIHTHALQVYEGEYWNDKRHGYGTYKWPSGAVFTGQFRNDRKDGKGVFHSEHGETFEVSCCAQTCNHM